VAPGTAIAYDPTLTLGNILQIVSLVIMTVGAILHFSGRLVKLETQVGMIMQYFGLTPKKRKEDE